LREVGFDNLNGEYKDTNGLSWQTEKLGFI